MKNIFNEISAKALNNLLEENNKLIAEFMGCTFERKSGINLVSGLLKFVPDWRRKQGTAISGTPYYVLEKLKFHKCWDWLMPVIEHIECLEGVSVNDITIGTTGTIIYAKILSTKEYFKPSFYSVNDNRLDSTYAAVVAFIKWYNLNK